jgi:hypothetical protein
VPAPTPNRYARWRAEHSVLAAFRDSADTPPEQLLQAVWLHQRLRRDQLVTLDGRTVRVLHPGFNSACGGPDFRDAVLQIGDAAAAAGDVEVDLRASGWHAHGHDTNPAFRNVILHVVWEAKPGGNRLATLALQPVLDAPLPELISQLEHVSLRNLPESLAGKCSGPLRELSEPALVALLHEAAHVRLQAKASQFRARAQQVGWEQSLWEGLFRALGYRHNSWPMQHLAEHRARWQRGAASPLQLQARLFGLSGLLPAELSRTQLHADDYLRRIWDCWWREADAFADCALPRRLWRFHGLRPANHPQRRLALAAHWAGRPGLIEQIQGWGVAPQGERALLDSLTRILQVPPDDFWSWHWTFRSARLAKPQPLLGEKRVTDLAVNAILPWLWTRADEGQNAALRRDIERRYETWPAAEDNAVLKLARQRLRGRAPFPNTAAAQQGLLQIVADFCRHSDATCDQCSFPELVRQSAVPMRTS